MNTKYFDECVKLAKISSKKKEIPIGAIIVQKNKILSKATNLRQQKHDITAHAEVIAIKKAAKKLKRWNLNDCDLYVSLKPCSMCENIINQSRIQNVYYLCEKLNYKKEYNKTTYQHINIQKLQNEYKKILSDFFTYKR